MRLGAGTEFALRPGMQSLLLALALLATGCVASQGAGLILPTQNEVGFVSMSDGEHSESGVRYKTALSWASVSPDAKTPVDVSIGYQVDQFSGPERAESRESSKTHKSNTMTDADGLTFFHGPIVEFSKHMGGTEHHRKWIGARVEMPMRQVNERRYYGIGAAIRASMELFVTTESDGVLGALGIGSYVEGGVRKIPGGQEAFVMSTGLSLRLPLAVVD